MVSTPKQTSNNCAGCVVCVCDKGERLVHVQRIDQKYHFVQERPPFAVGEYDTFVDATGQRDCEDALGGPHEHGDCLAGVAENVLRLVLASDC